MQAFILGMSHRDGTLGPQLHESTIKCPRFVTGAPLPTPDPDRWCGIRAVGGVITGHSVSAPEIAANLSGYPFVGRPVVDRTGLTGPYDFRLEFAPGFADATDSDTGNAPGLFTALREQLGLTLRSEKAVVPVIVIDHVEQPTPD
jgi:uncharacterized protein (TIGR03435 family)